MTVAMIEYLLEPHVCRRFLCDERYREGHLRVVNALPQRRVLGLHTPEMKQLAKNLHRRGCDVSMPDGTLHHCTCGSDVVRCFEQTPPKLLCHEEIMIWGFLINMEKCPFVEKFRMLEHFVPVLDNWAVCDAFCANAKWMARTDKGVLWAFLERWFASEREFEVRFAIVASMCSLLCEGWTERVFARIDRLDFGAVKSEYRSVKGKPACVQEGCVQGAEPYYVRMGAAWLLATALAKFPEQTRAFVNSSSLPADVVKLYVRKARESFRTRKLDAL